MVRGLVFVMTVMAAGSVASALSEYEQLISSLDPIHWLKFDDPANSPTANDAIGNLNGEWHNGPNSVPGLLDESHVAARFWNAQGKTWAIFDHQDSLLLPEGTIAFWVVDTTKVLDTAILSKDALGRGDGGHLTIGTKPGATVAIGSLYVRLQSETDNYQVNTGLIAADTAYHVAFTFGAGGMKLYLDGDLVDQNAYTGGLTGNFEPLVLGASTAWSSPGTANPLNIFWSGILDELLIFDYPLNHTQVQHLHVGHVPEPASLTLLALSAGLLLRRRARR